jgi:hypothetical protein
VATRYGLQTALQGPNQAAITGLASLIYTPENPGGTLFQVPMVFDTDGYLLVESPAGSGLVFDAVLDRGSSFRPFLSPGKRFSGWRR